MCRFGEYLPYVPSKEEAWRFISSMSDLKQKTMVTIIYSSGLRTGEVCRFCYKGVDRKNMRPHISRDRDRSARYAILLKAALDPLTRYWLEYGRSMGYLPPRQHGEDKPVDTFFFSRRIHAHEDRLGWEHRITCHSFRHASGARLYEDGVDPLIIKAPMGHKSLTFTTIYTHLAANGTSPVVNPFNRLADVCHE